MQKYALFCAWIPKLNNTFVQFTHYGANSCILFILIAVVWHCVHIAQISHRFYR